MANIGIGPLGAMQYVQAQGELGRQRGREQFTQRTAGEIINGDPAAYGKLAAVDPAAARAAQSDGDAQLRRMGGLIKFFEEADARDPNEAQALWVSQGVPYVRQFANGAEPTQSWQEAKPMIQSLKAKIAAAEAAANTATDQPTAFRALDAQARAAGFAPGSPEYQNFMRVNGGVVGRAATGGFGFEKITGADGRERLARKNPRTGAVEIYDETTGDFTPLGGGASLNGPTPGAPNAAPPTPGPTLVAGEVPFTIDPSLPPEVQAAIRANPQGAAAIQDGGTLPVSSTGPVPAQAAQAPRGANPALGVSRTPEEQAAATEAAKQAAQTAALAEQERIKREAAVQQANEIARGKTDAEVAAKQGQRDRDALNTLDLLDQAEALLPKSTSGGAEALVSDIAAYFGHTTEGRAKIAALAPIAAKLVGYVPRFEGPQSDRDVQLYRDAAGDLANPNKPVGERIAALQQMRALSLKYAGSMGSGGGGQAAPAPAPAPQAPAPAGVDHSNLWN
jgi:hypothetical protein